MNTASSAPPNHRSATLDCIRAIAILAVFFYHVTSRYETSGLDPVAALFARYGFLGVDMFFPLSGFLVTRFLIQSREDGIVRTFFLRRFFRIVPLYFVAIAIYFVASRVVGFDDGIIHRIWINLTFLTGIFIFIDGVSTVPFTITWSLSVEEFGYILIGAFFWLQRRNMGVILAAICLLSFLLRAGFLFYDASDFKSLYYFPPTRLDSICIGGVVAVLLNNGQRHLLAGIAVLSGVLVGAMALGAFAFHLFLFPGIALATSFIIVFFETTRLDLETPAIRLFSRIGFYSYFNYLFQFFNIEAVLIGYRLVSSEPPPFWLAVLIALCLTQIEAIISYKIFEKPLMRFGRGLERKPIGAS